MSAVSLLEIRMVTFGRFGTVGLDRLSALFETMNLEIMPFGEAQANAAFAAFVIYGKGVHAKARLNMGDCASYALAKSLNAPLLFKGEDFAATDVVPAV